MDESVPGPLVETEFSRNVSVHPALGRTQRSLLKRRDSASGACFSAAAHQQHPEQHRSAQSHGFRKGQIAPGCVSPATDSSLDAALCSPWELPVRQRTTSRGASGVSRRASGLVRRDQEVSAQALQRGGR